MSDKRLDLGQQRLNKKKVNVSDTTPKSVLLFLTLATSSSSFLA